jgi:predicted lysophospholipase L1 biosynthesis ABC-type transport system permease subunit
MIALLVLIAAVLATAGATGAMIWQRRPQIAYLKRQGYQRAVLWRTLVYESGLLLGTGCLIGAIFGLYGQVLLSRALSSVTGFPVLNGVGPLVALWSVAVVSLAAVAIVAAPGYMAAREAPSVNPG